MGSVFSAECFLKHYPQLRFSIMMKKMLIVAAATLLATGANAAYKDGTYVGEGQGNESVIQVQVDVKGGKIADVKILKHQETEMMIAAAVDMMVPTIVEKNGIEGVEAVAGATMSSEGIKKAVVNALSKAK